jgi:hypothetical protein
MNLNNIFKSFILYSLCANWNGITFTHVHYSIVAHRIFCCIIMGPNLVTILKQHIIVPYYDSIVVIGGKVIAMWFNFYSIYYTWDAWRQCRSGALSCPHMPNLLALAFFLDKHKVFHSSLGQYLATSCLL